MCAVLLYSSAAAGINEGITATAEFLHQKLRLPAKEFTEKPTKVFKGNNPRRDEARSGWWTPKLKADRARIKVNRALDELGDEGWFASINEYTNLALQGGIPPGEAKKLTMPDGAVEEWSFNGTGQTTAYTSPLNYVINYVYDDAGKQTTVDYPTGTDTVLSYDNAGRRTSMLDSTGTSTWTLDAASQVTQLVTPQGTQSYTYNDAGQRATMVESGLGTTHTIYDTHGRYSDTVNRHGEVTHLAYDALGRAYRKFLQNGLYEEYLYDASNRLVSVGVWNPSTGTNVRMETYTYNLANQMTSKTVGGVTTSYTYDLAGQLASESRPGYSCSYTYDANGNRLTKTLNGVTESYTYDDGDKMLTAGSKSYGYDAAGRTTSVTNGSSVTTLNYDWESRLTSLSGATTASYTYNGLDTRVSKIEGGVTNTYARDGVGVTAPVIRDTFASYTPGTSEKRGTTTTYLHSGLKNAEMQTDVSKAVSATKQYDAFGNAVSATGTWQGAFGYAGGFGYQEDSSGLKLLGHRYYDSSTGRFLTRDPAKDGRNWYVYCESNPVTYADSTGRAGEGIVFRVVKFIGGHWRQEAGFIGKGQAINVVENGGSVVVIGQGAKREAKDVAQAAYDDVIHHGVDDHDQPVGTPWLHYQGGGKHDKGHVFYRLLTTVVAFLFGTEAARGNVEGALNDNINPVKIIRDIEKEFVEPSVNGFVEDNKTHYEERLRYWLDE